MSFFFNPYVIILFISLYIPRKEGFIASGRFWANTL